MCVIRTNGLWQKKTFFTREKGVRRFFFFYGRTHCAYSIYIGMRAHVFGFFFGAFVQACVNVSDDEFRWSEAWNNVYDLDFLLNI